ncbi:MAG: SPFH domain-containing protein [Oscillospiraceae bacterium]|nr:SPFH domain-containing protein [Clostridiales bacterium]
MSKFVIECPNCGKYAEARTGFFARKKIDCACGYTIDVRTDKLAGRECPHCGNMVVFDQSKGEKALCPVCHEPINTMAEQSNTVEFSCAQCGVRLRTNKAAATYTCPVCDCVNDVAERVATEKIKKDGLASIIKYEGDNETLVWKHPIEDFNFGSQLIVHESQEAIFFRDGQALDLFGAGRYTLQTQQLPLLEKLYKLPTDTEGTFHSEVYFVNLATQMGIKWGTDSKVRLFDPASGLHIEIGASGEFNIRVTDSRKLLLKVVGTTGGLGQEQLLGIGNGKGFFRSMVMTQVKSYLAQTIRENAISILEIDEHLMALSGALRERINAALDEYGLTMPEFYVSRIVTPDDDPNFRRMKEQYAEQYLLVRQENIRKAEAEAAADRKAVEAQTAARMKIIGAQGEAEALKIQKQAEAEAYRMQAEAEAAEMCMKGYTYQQETSRQVGLEAMKNGLGGGANAAGALGDLAGLGVSLGAMGSVIGMTKDALNPMTQDATQMGAAVGAAVAGGWDCPVCGHKNITTNFCPDCGGKKPEAKIGWDCAQCGTKNIQSKFCPNCGAKKPEEPTGWTCPECGAKDIQSRFCPNCGARKPEEKHGWICPDCGTKDIMTNFCPNCGRKKDEFC